jgi:hypothetical protein
MRFFFFIYSTISITILAQNLSVGLSVNCKIDTIHFDIPPLKSDTIIDVPFLKFTFQNFTGKNIYLKNPYQPKGQYPPIVPASMINTSMDLADQVRLCIIHQLGRSFIVEIEDGWSIYTE